MTDLISLAARVTGREIALDQQPSQPGDVHDTAGSIERAQQLLDWSPQLGLEEGLRAQASWQREQPR